MEPGFTKHTTYISKDGSVYTSYAAGGREGDDRKDKLFLFYMDDTFLGQTVGIDKMKELFMHIEERDRK
jgi:hypothetical protein